MRVIPSESTPSSVHSPLPAHREGEKEASQVTPPAENPRLAGGGSASEKHASLTPPRGVDVITKKGVFSGSGRRRPIASSFYYFLVSRFLVSRCALGASLKMKARKRRAIGEERKRGA